MSFPSTRIETEMLADRWIFRMIPPSGKPPALDLKFLSELEEAIAEAEEILNEEDADAPRLIIVESSSPRYFCVGSNIGVLETLSEETMPDWIRRGHSVFNRLEDLAVPVIAKIRGYALGGGLELAMACDLIVCDDTAKIGLTEAGVGFVPGWGGSFRLPRRVGVSQAKRLFYRCEKIEASEAAAIGLADVVTTAAKLDNWVDAFVKDVCSTSRMAIKGFKRIVNDAEKSAREADLVAESEWSQSCIADPDTGDRIRAFLNRKK